MIHLHRCADGRTHGGFGDTVFAEQFRLPLGSCASMTPHSRHNIRLRAGILKLADDGGDNVF